MTTLTWIAVAFAAGLLIFLMATWFNREPTPQQAQTLRFFSALTAGLLGGSVIAGTMDLRLSGNVELIELVGTFGGGAALAVLIWLTYPRYAPTPKAGLNFKVAPGSTLENTARALAGLDHAGVEFQGFTPEHLNGYLHPGEYRTAGLAEALAMLGRISVKPLPQLRVDKQNSVYILHLPFGHDAPPPAVAVPGDNQSTS